MTLYVGNALKSQRLEVAPTDDGAVSVVVERPVVCAGCGVVAMVFINRDGKTLCSARCAK